MNKLAKVLEQKESDPNDAEVTPDLPCPPPGEYRVVINECDVKIKDDQTAYMRLEFEIEAPKYTSWKVWHNITLLNQNDTAERIGDEQLKMLTLACGFDAVDKGRSEEEYVGKRLHIKTNADDDEYQGEVRIRANPTSFTEAKGTPKGPKNEEKFQEWVREVEGGSTSTDTDDDSFDDDDIPF